MCVCVCVCVCVCWGWGKVRTKLSKMIIIVIIITAGVLTPILINVLAFFVRRFMPSISAQNREDNSQDSSVSDTKSESHYDMPSIIVSGISYLT